MKTSELTPSESWLKFDPDISLRTKTIPVNFPLLNDDEFIIQKMIKYIDASYYGQYKKFKIKPGIGIAAPQLGYGKSMFYIHFDELVNKKIIKHKYLLINPKILSESQNEIYLNTGEGCLSIKEEYCGYVYRKESIKIEAYNYFQKKVIIIHAKNLLSICMQHELDHLNGILFYDLIDKQNPFKIKSNTKVI